MRSIAKLNHHQQSYVFQTFRDFFDIILKEIHNFGSNNVHPKPDLDRSKVEQIGTTPHRTPKYPPALLKIQPIAALIWFHRVLMNPRVPSPPSLPVPCCI